jgi:hypothetical protein
LSLSLSLSLSQTVQITDEPCPNSPWFTVTPAFAPST